MAESRRVVLLARPGEACERLRAALREAGGDLVLEADPCTLAPDALAAAAPQVVLVALDPARGEAAIMPGYGLEALLKKEALDHLLELAGPAWEDGRWADGIFRVLDGLDQLLESVAIPEAANGKTGGEV